MLTGGRMAALRTPLQAAVHNSTGINSGHTRRKKYLLSLLRLIPCCSFFSIMCQRQR